MAKIEEEASTLLDAGSETELLVLPADNLSGGDLEMLYARRAEIEEELVYGDDDEILPVGLLRMPTVAQTLATKDKLEQEDLKRKKQAEEERDRQEALSLESYHEAMGGFIAQDKDLLAKSTAMQSQVKELQKH